MTDSVAIDFGTSRTKLAYLDSRSQKPLIIMVTMFTIAGGEELIGKV